MVRIERGNVVLNVEDYDVDRYLSMGYNVTDEQGNILRKAVPTQLGELQKAYVENMATIEMLTAQVAELTAKLEQKSRKTKAKSEE